MSLNHFLLLATLLFSIGLYGAFTRRNAIGILMSIELMLNAANLVFVACARFLYPQTIYGQAFAAFVIALAAAEAVVGLGLVLSIYRSRNTLLADEVSLMKW